MAARAIKPDTVKPRSMAPPSSPGYGQPQPRSNELEFDAINKSLVEACQIIEASRNKVIDRQLYSASIQNAADQQRTLQLERSEAYSQLYAQHEKAMADLQKISDQCLSLSQQLDKAKENISDYETVTGQLEAKIRALEEDKATVAESHERELILAGGLINAAERKVDELEKEKQDMTQEHQVALSTAGRKADEIQQEWRTSKPQVLIDTTKRAASSKRQKPESFPESEYRPSRRLRARGSKASKDDDTITVHT